MCCLLSFILFSKYQSSPAMLTVTATGVIVKMENVCASWTIITDWTAPYPDVSKGSSFSKSYSKECNKMGLKWLNLKSVKLGYIKLCT